MGNIVLLDDLTINKIAAGEVVERPASVVKELVENSIDAGATNISIEIKNGGISYIRITDNGKGIAEDDIEIAFERHATSKIRQAEDLDFVKSMGFRGEALASVAAIANVELISKTQDSDIGNRIVVEAGNILEKNEIARPTGTTITVKNLFFNTPVRYKFLKKDYTEAGYIEDTITRLALINPNISFKLINTGKVIIKTYGDGNLNNVIYSIFGKDIASDTVDVNYKYEGINIKGVVGKPKIARSNRANQLFFVNKRYVKDKTLSGATEQAFKGLLPTGKYGFLVLNVEVDPSKVDVNVHPAKLEVRFEEENNIFKAVYHAIKDSLLKDDLVDNVLKDNEETKSMELIVPEEKKRFGKIFGKSKKQKEDWEVNEPVDNDNYIANIYNNKYSNEKSNIIEENKSEYETKNSDNIIEEKTIITENKNYNNNNNRKKLDSLNLDINTNVLEKIAMLQKQVAEDLEKNPNLVFDRSKLEEEKRKLQELRKSEMTSSESIMTVKEEQQDNKEEIKEIEIDENINKENEQNKEEIKQDEGNNCIEENTNQDVITENVNDEDKNEISENAYQEKKENEHEEEFDVKEEKQYDNLDNEVVNNSNENTDTVSDNIEIKETTEKLNISNNQILQSSEEDNENNDNIDRILKEAIAKKFDLNTIVENNEEINNEEEKQEIEKEQDDKKIDDAEETEFEQMYAKIFGRTLNDAKKDRENEEKQNLADDIVKYEGDDLNNRVSVNPYGAIKNNNISVFEDKKEYRGVNYKFIGIAFSTYIIIEIKKELYIIDQHAAHERIMYEKVKKNFYSNTDKDSQLLLLPDIITLNYKEMDIVRDNWNVFKKAGFELESFGENTIKLTGVPEICFDLDTKELFLETLDEINTVARTAKQEIEEKFIATIACKAAVKANMALNDEEVKALLEQLLQLPNPFTCPHGRPTAIKMNKFDLEKKFSRRK